MLTKVSSENAAAETDENADDPILEERNGVDGDELTKERGESLKDAEQLFEADFPGFTIDDDFPGWSSTSNTDQVGTTDVVSSTNSWDYNLPGVSLCQSGLIGGSMSDNLYAQGMMSQQYEMEDSGSGYQQQALNISLCEPGHFDSDLPRSGNFSRNLHFLLPSTSPYGVQLPNTNFLNNINSAALETITPNRDPPGRLSVQLPNIYVDVVVGQTSALATNITPAELLLSPSSAYNNHRRSFSSSNINVEEIRCKCTVIALLWECFVELHVPALIVGTRVITKTLFKLPVIRYKCAIRMLLSPA
uniref:Uncharacterized protein n=1 Tax=Kalanchoe fedtschenkoi TaxID=63787 RepID=A0A7N0UZW1_KALFE